MEVKDLPKQSAVQLTSVDGGGAARQISGRSLLSQSRVISSDKVEISSTPKFEAPPTGDLRLKTNDVINATNIAREATVEIEKLVKSIGGIIEQVQREDIPQQRKSVLEHEANSLVEEIRRKALVTTSDGVRPLAGDRIRLEVEEKLGRALEVILPKDASEAFGIGNIRFSTKELIVSTVANIRSANERIKEIRNAVDDSLEKLKGVVDEIDVAHQNTEAASASVRDVDAALELASKTKLEITANPESALNSVGQKLDSKSLDLLK